MDIHDGGKRIDEIDGQLGELLSGAFPSRVIEIGKIKRQRQLPVYDYQCEKGKFSNASRANMWGRWQTKRYDGCLKTSDESRRVERGWFWRSKRRRVKSQHRGPCDAPGAKTRKRTTPDTEGPSF